MLVKRADQIKKASTRLVRKEDEISKDNITWLEVECLGACC